MHTEPEPELSRYMVATLNRSGKILLLGDLPWPPPFLACYELDEDGCHQTQPLFQLEQLGLVTRLGQSVGIAVSLTI